MSVHDICETEIISESPSCTVTRCSNCKTYHLHIGPVSLRLKQDMFINISNTILSAQLLIVDEKNFNLQANYINH